MYKHDCLEKLEFKVGERTVKFHRHSDHTDVYLYHAGKDYWYSHITLPADAIATQKEAEECIELIEKVVGELDHETVNGIRLRKD